MAVKITVEALPSWARHIELALQRDKPTTRFFSLATVETALDGSSTVLPRVRTVTFRGWHGSSGAFYVASDARHAKVRFDTELLLFCFDDCLASNCVLLAWHVTGWMVLLTCYHLRSPYLVLFCYPGWIPTFEATTNCVFFTLFV